MVHGAMVFDCLFQQLPSCFVLILWMYQTSMLLCSLVFLSRTISQFICTLELQIWLDEIGMPAVDSMNAHVLKAISTEDNSRLLSGFEMDNPCTAQRFSVQDQKVAQAALLALDFLVGVETNKYENLGLEELFELKFSVQRWMVLLLGWFYHYERGRPQSEKKYCLTE